MLFGLFIFCRFRRGGGSYGAPHPGAGKRVPAVLPAGSGGAVKYYTN